MDLKVWVGFALSGELLDLSREVQGEYADQVWAILSFFSDSLLCESIRAAITQS